MKRKHFPHPLGHGCPECGSNNVTTYMSIMSGIEYEGVCNECRAQIVVKSPPKEKPHETE